MPVRYAIPVILLAAAAALPAFAPQSTVVAAIIIAFDCYLAQCWNLAAGYAGLFSLGHGIFLAIGAYTSTILLTRYGVSPFLGMWAGAALAALAGAALSAVAFRYRVRGVFFAVVTLSALEVVRALFEDWDFVGANSGIVMVLSNDPANMMFSARWPYYELILAFVALLAFGTSHFARSRFGQFVVALREDEAAAEASGVPTFRCKVAVVALSAACTALAGTFYAQFLLFIAPDTLFGFDNTLTMMQGTIVGGSGTVAGPIVGSLLFGILSDVLRTLPFADSREMASLLGIVYAVVLLIVALRLPGGLVSLVAARVRPAR
jgi:branched-chain amino acid transport system permease protein